MIALVVVAGDLVVKNPHYAACMLLEPGSWSWWLNGCFIYDPVSALAATGLALGAAKLVSWLAGRR